MEEVREEEGECQKGGREGGRRLSEGKGDRERERGSEGGDGGRGGREKEIEEGKEGEGCWYRGGIMDTMHLDCARLGQWISTTHSLQEGVTDLRLHIILEIILRYCYAVILTSSACPSLLFYTWASTETRHELVFGGRRCTGRCRCDKIKLSFICSGSIYTWPLIQKHRRRCNL